MKIQSNQFGEFEFDETMVYKFKDGIIGFEKLHNFILLNTEESIFYWLISVDEPEIIFPLFPVKPLLLNYPEDEGFEPFGVVNLNKNPEEITINLKSPVYINTQEKKGYQTILDDDTYLINYNLFIKE
jgi:flagellar assembly factor FliW